MTFYHKRNFVKNDDLPGTIYINSFNFSAWLSKIDIK